MTARFGTIPSWNSNGLVPPYLGNPASNAERSPYEVLLADLVSQFGCTQARRQILGGFLNFRAALHQAGLVEGFQWVNGSFVEDVMQRRNREPDDIDVVTFYYPPNGHSQRTLRYRFPRLFNPDETKILYHTDAHYIEPNAYEMPLMVRLVAYWNNLWGHTKDTDEWKGYFQIDLSDVEDAAARNILGLANGNGGAP